MSLGDNLKRLRTDKGMEVLKTQLHELEKIATVITAPSDDTALSVRITIIS